MLEVPAHLLDERSRTDAGRFDEMWEGVLHMVPSPSEEHQRIEIELAFALREPAATARLHLRTELGLFDPAVAEPASYRLPDLVLFGEEVRSERGVEGGAALVIEIRSPGDESLEKLPFYERVGAAEVVVVDRDTKELRHWLRAGDRLAEQPLGGDGGLRLVAVPVTFRSDGGRLHVRTTGTDVVI
jgi:Uma2 family endonuclease